MNFKTILRALTVSIAFAATMGACAPEDNAPSEEESSPLLFVEAYEFRIESGAVVTECIEGEESFEIPSSACECRSQKCQEAWVTENFGCGICVDVVCEDGSSSGGCVLCPEGL